MAVLRRGRIAVQRTQKRSSNETNYPEEVSLSQKREREEREDSGNKKLDHDSGQWRKVSSNIRHGECGDVDLGCIPVLLVAYMSAPVYMYMCECKCASVHTSSFRSTADAHLRGQI